MAPPLHWAVVWRRALSHTSNRLKTARCLTAWGAFGSRYAFGGNAANVTKLHHSHLQYLSVLRAGVAVRATTEELRRGVTLRQKTQAIHLLVQHKSIVTQVTDETDLPAFWQQGDAELSTHENMCARESLSRAPAVIEALEAFWNVEVTMNFVWSQPIEDGGRAKAAERVAKKLVTREGFDALYLRVYKVLLEAWDEADARESIADDWATDTQGTPGLSREAFEVSLFELSDVWTKGIDAQEYADWLWALYRGLTDGDGRFRDLEQCGYNGDLADGIHDHYVEAPQHREISSYKAKRRKSSVQIQKRFRAKTARKQRQSRADAAEKIGAVVRGRLVRKRAAAGKGRENARGHARTKARTSQRADSRADLEPALLVALPAQQQHQQLEQQHQQVTASGWAAENSNSAPPEQPQGPPLTLSLRLPMAEVLFEGARGIPRGGSARLRQLRGALAARGAAIVGDAERLEDGARRSLVPTEYEFKPERMHKQGSRELLAHDPAASFARGETRSPPTSMPPRQPSAFARTASEALGACTSVWSSPPCSPRVESAASRVLTQGFRGTAMNMAQQPPPSPRGTPLMPSSPRSPCRGGGVAMARREAAGLGGTSRPASARLVPSSAHASRPASARTAGGAVVRTCKGLVPPTGAEWVRVQCEASSTSVAIRNEIERCDFGAPSLRALNSTEGGVPSTRGLPQASVALPREKGREVWDYG